MSSSGPSSSKPQDLANQPTASQPIDNDADDLDDLDDVLDEFNNPQPSSSASGPPKSQPPPPPVASSSSATPAASTNAETSTKTDAGNDQDNIEDILSQDFAKELASQMEALMKQIGGNNNPASAGLDTDGGDNAQGDAQFNEEELMKQFEAMMAGLGNPGTAAPAQDKATPSSSTPKASSTPAQQPANFNDALKATMNRLKESDASATASNSTASDPFAALAGADGDEMAKLLAALGGAGGEDGEDNPELAKMLEGMMDELMSKEILYEPLKELRDKYPAYLEGPDSTGIPAEDRTRYEQQFKHVSDIVAVFEDPNYDVKNRDMARKVQDLMNQMQDRGSPPKEIVGDMPPELENMPGLGGEDGECCIM